MYIKLNHLAVHLKLAHKLYSIIKVIIKTKAFPKFDILSQASHFIHDLAPVIISHRNLVDHEMV